MSQINYEKIEIPEDEDYRDWTFAERRAYILDEIKDKGHPRLIDQKGIANRFGVSQSQINQDVDAIADSVNEYLGRGADFKFKTIYDKAIMDLLEEDDKQELRRWVKDFKEFLMERGKVNKEAERHEVRVDGLDEQVSKIIEISREASEDEG